MSFFNPPIWNDIAQVVSHEEPIKWVLKILNILYPGVLQYLILLGVTAEKKPIFPQDKT